MQQYYTVSLLMLKLKWVTYSVCDPQINQENKWRMESSHLFYNLIRSYKFSKLPHYKHITVKNALQKGPMRLSQVRMVASHHFSILICHMISKQAAIYSFPHLFLLFSVCDFIYNFSFVQASVCVVMPQAALWSSQGWSSSFIVISFHYSPLISLHSLYTTLHHLYFLS